MEPLNRLELLPVLELEPGRYKTSERDFPTEGGAENPEGWDRYWRDCLADSGVVGIEPLHRGSWFLSTAHLSSGEVLSKIISIESEAWGGLASIKSVKDVSPLSGGFVLKAAGITVLEPGCCGDLANLWDWKKAAGQTDGGWAMLWTGHPWPSSRLACGVLEISRPSDDAVGDILCAVRPADLRAAILAAQAEIERFAGHLTTVVQGLMTNGEAAAIARALAGLIQQ